MALRQCDPDLRACEDSFWIRHAAEISYVKPVPRNIFRHFRHSLPQSMILVIISVSSEDQAPAR